MLPGWMYMYMSAVADVNANPKMLNGSSLYFDTNCSYPNWLETLPFNHTIPLFGPSAWRWDDYRDSENYLREMTLRTVMIKDVGAGTENYTDPKYKINPWFKLYPLPDFSAAKDSITKFTYTVGIRYSNKTGQFASEEYITNTFFGPGQPGQTADDIGLPVLFTPPYMDCGKSNQWIMSTVSPVIDYMYRYSNYTHLRRPRIVALSVMDIYFKRIDFNSCPVSIGNPGPSYLSGISRCKTRTTQCKHVPGYGFKRGGYICPCRAGFHCPKEIDPPFKGKIIEQATDEEYAKGFECIRTDLQTVLPSNKKLEGLNDDIIQGVLSIATWDRTKRSVDAYMTKHFRRRYLMSLNDTHTEFQAHDTESNSFAFDTQRFLQMAYQKRKNINSIRKLKLRHRRSLVDEKAVDRIRQIFGRVQSVSRKNCAKKSSWHLQLPGDVAYGVENQFEPQSRTALRLSHFLCNYLQNANPLETFGIHRGGRHLHQGLIFGEVLANVMADFRIMSSGVFYDHNLFLDDNGHYKELFGPWAYRQQGRYFAIDRAGEPEQYIYTDWFQKAKQRWRTNTSGLKTYWMRAHIRSDINGTSSIRFDYYPMRYKAPVMSDGFWTRPYFRCDGYVDKWVITYVVPFFGLDNLKKAIKFYGVVTVDVPLRLLKINQCPQPFYIANAFKNTARCPETSNCKLLHEFGFSLGGYKCTCRQGTEYKIIDGKYWLEGVLLEVEYLKKKRGMANRFDTLRCRISAAPPSSKYSFFVVAILLLVALYLLYRPPKKNKPMEAPSSSPTSPKPNGATSSLSPNPSQEKTSVETPSSPSQSTSD
ncbi:unnamed protein product [Acanthosepion pharaonis]|uniref:GPR158/179 extracellular domain-containing protein n=1 Tax=Acanthosepion pharaonis TaxID=158019 RepID=A0A812CN51_ACAPH|nr:unnamed protein product [Sepia pharaonis]